MAIIIYEDISSFLAWKGVLKVSRLFVLGLFIALLVTISYTWAKGISDGWTTDSDSELQVGQAKSSFCARCHGVDGYSKIPGIPNLAGQQKDYLIKQLKDFRSGFRRSAPMREVARTLSNREITSLAIYFNSLPPAKSAEEKLID